MGNLHNKTNHLLMNVKDWYRFITLTILKFFYKYHVLIIMIVATILGLVARYKMVLYPTHDVVGYIFKWMEDIKTQGFSNFYKIDADYSPLFLFMIGILSLLPTGKEIKVNGSTFYQNYMIYIKSIYFIFSILLCIGVFLIIYHFTKSKTKSMLGYIIAFSLPTVFVNSTIWGNCDVIYATYIIYTFYFILKKKDRLVWVFFGLAFANKMQAVFILPYLVYLILNRKLRLSASIFAIITFFITLIPCYICGASFKEPFMFIDKQLNGYKLLTLGCANMWHFMNFRGNVVSDNATWFGLLLIGVVLAIVYFRKIDLDNDENKFKTFFLLTMSTIFFLPYMHERYFYLIDVAVIIYAFIDRKKVFFVPLMQISSGIAYYHYLSGHYFIDSWGEDSVHIAAIINVIILIIVFIEILKLDHGSFKDEIDKINEELTTKRK